MLGRKTVNIIKIPDKVNRARDSKIPDNGATKRRPKIAGK